MSSDFSLSGITGFLAARAAQALAAQTSKAKLADTSGPLANQRVQARSLSKPSNPNAGQVIAESTENDMGALYSTRGSATPFRQGLIATFDRHLSA